MLDKSEQYRGLIEGARAEKRIWEPFKYEEHHILPKCLGGTDAKKNLVLLTIKEHFKAHLLLADMYPENGGLALACVQMLDGCRGQTEEQKATEFEYLRIRAAKFISKVHKGRKKSEAEIENIRRARLTAKPRKFSEEARANMAEARKKTWEERRANGTDKEIFRKVVETRRKNGSYEFSQEWKDNIGKGGLGRTPWNKGTVGVLTEETLAKMSAAKKGKPSPHKGKKTGKPAWNSGKKRVSEATRENADCLV